LLAMGLTDRSWRNYSLKYRETNYWYLSNDFY